MERLDSDTSRLVVGDDYDVIRDLTNFVAVEIETAWLTIKSSPFDADAAAVIQKEITQTPVDGEGSITMVDDDSSAGAELTFQLTADETATMSAYEQYSYDIQIKSTAGKISTIESGVVTPVRQITESTT